jgi:hypothetical protein
MKELYELFNAASPWLVGLAVIAYFIKFTLEKTIDSRFKRMEAAQARALNEVTEIAKTSLSVKQAMRKEERDALVECRVAIETWEDALLRMIVEVSMGTGTINIEKLMTDDNALFLKVKLGIVRACIYLREPELERQLLSAVLKIRQTYYPLIQETMPRLIDLQAKAADLNAKVEAALKGAGALTAQDRDENLRVQTAITNEIRSYSEALLAGYRPLAEQLHGLKEQTNQYVYRDMASSRISES